MGCVLVGLMLNSPNIQQYLLKSSVFFLNHTQQAINGQLTSLLKRGCGVTRGTPKLNPLWVIQRTRANVCGQFIPDGRQSIKIHCIGMRLKDVLQSLVRVQKIAVKFLKRSFTTPSTFCVACNAGWRGTRVRRFIGGS